MNKFKNSFLCKTIATLLSLLIIISAMPIMMMPAFAATEEISDYVTITVTDEDGNALEGATVEFVLNSKANGDGYIQKEEITDKNGCVKVLPSEEYIEGDLAITATISKEKYQTDISINEFIITDSKQDIVVKLKSSIIDDVVITGQTLTYSGEPQKAVIVSKKDNDSVVYDYSSDNVTLKDGEPYVTDAGTYEFNVTVSREGFEPFKQTVTTTVNKANIENIIIEPIEGLKYNEEEQDLVKVSGINPETDTVKYEVNGQEVEVDSGTVPQESAVGKYKVKLTVDRGNNYNQFTKTVESEIALGKIDLGGLTVTGLDSVYTGEEQEVVEIIGKGDYNLQYKLDGVDTDFGDIIPTVTDAGSYTVYVRAVKDNYEEETVEVIASERIYPFNVYVAKQEQSISFNDDNYENGQATSIDLDTAKGKTLDFSADGGVVDADIVYSVENVSDDGIVVDEIAEIDSKGILKINAAGCINIIASKPGDKNHESVSISHEVLITATGNGLVKFEREEIKYTFGENEGVASNAFATNVYKDDNGTHSYSIDQNDIGLKCDEKTGEIAISDYKTLSEELEETGKISVTVTVKKSKGTKTTETKDIPAKPNNTNAIYFSDAYNWGNVYLYYWLNDNDNNTWPGQKMEYYTKNDLGQSVYRLCIPKNVKGIVFSNGTDNKQTNDIVTNIYDNVNFYPINNDNKCKVGSVTWTYDTKTETKDIYGEDSSSYLLEISAADIPDTPYILEGEKGQNEWYVSDVTVKPSDADNYTISKEPTVESFSQSVLYDDEGTNDRYIYLKSKTGGITPKIKIDGLKIDTQKPDANNLSIEFSKPNTDKDNTKYYKEGVTVTFMVEDELDDNESGVQYIDWKYTKSGNATSSILTEKKNRILNVEKKDGKYVASITLDSDDQYRGNISFTVTDNAGNESEVKFNDTVIVVDEINPKMQAAHQLVNPEETYNPVGNIHYYSNDVKFTFTVNEANFFEDDFKVQMSKDGAENKDVSVTWQHDDEIHIGSFVISGDGDYKVYVNPDYIDRSGNIAKDEKETDIVGYESDVITIDTIQPVIERSFNEKTQSIQFKVTEHNFRASDISVVSTVVDINGNPISVNDINKVLHSAEWTQNGDVYTYETAELADGLYNYTISYTDTSYNKADDSSIEFTIDHSSPSNPEITYSTPVTESVINTLTFGFYNPTVNVTFTSYDKFSGVSNFKWSYIKQSGASNINVDSDDEFYTGQNISAIQDIADKSKFTATITLPKSQADQLRGFIAATATDNYNNVSQKITDDKNIIVVDNITPEMSVEFSKASRTVGETMYYGNDKNGKAIVTFNVNEANFYSEDVKVSVSKNGGEKKSVPDVVWSDKSTDEHIGVYTISGDGHYVVYVDYTDRSNNKMTSYISDTITIDTVKPVIKVDYDNKNVIEKLTDSEKHNRSYFDAKQKATITITEHNFDSKEVDLSKITAKDVTGKTLELSNLISYSSWTDKGDVHTLNITYSGDANYTFDVDYTDLANNKSDNYKPDYFTVDTKAPVVTSVSYSTSVLDTVIGNVSFGFYGTRMNVTLTATDDTSGVYGFVYNYRNASNVSGVNAELINQAIEEGSITYSADGRTATLVFNIPKEALGSNNQFNGTVDFTSTDRSHNEVKQQENKRIVVDNISPICSVAYNTPVNEFGGISYYDGNINGTITVDEANFYSQDVNVTYSINGSTAGTLPVTWSNNSVDEHIGTFTLSGDGDYIVRISYTDKSGNAMEAYTSNQLTIDTKIDNPTYTINGTAKTENGGAYKDDANIGFSYSDQNFNTRDIKLTRTRFKDKDVDVTDQFIKGNEVTNDNGGSGSFDIPKKVENDGIYTLTVSMTDKANHSTTSRIKFTINRYGSVYEYSDYLMSLIKDGGQYITIEDGADSAITDNLVITEYNADKIVKDSLNILITRDGEPIDVAYKSNPEITDKAEIGSSGWYQYSYSIDKSNFAKDGVYKISLSSKDATRNESISVPENSIDANGNAVLDTMQFTVDTTAPEIRNIVNLDQEIINAQEINVKYSLVDIGGLNTVEIFVDDKNVDSISDFSESINEYSGEFTIKEKNEAQTVRIKVTDLAGNVTDTRSESFSSGDKYVFFDTVTVSTNVFVRWFANKPLFFGSIGGAVAVICAISVFFTLRLRKKEKVK